MCYKVFHEVCDRTCEFWTRKLGATQQLAVLADPQVSRWKAECAIKCFMKCVTVPVNSGHESWV
jgi:hypothetical protein